MLIPYELEVLLDADGEEKFKAKSDLNAVQKQVLREFDAEYFFYSGEHIITNYQVLG